MRTSLTGCLLLAAIFAAVTTFAGPSPRPHLNSGACLSCHAGQLATLPSVPCISCHAHNMDFLREHEGPNAAGPWALGAIGGGAILVLLGLGFAGIRRATPALAALAVVVLALPEGDPPPCPPIPGAVRVAEGFACDLAPVLSPAGNALLFSRRGPDTDADGRVDLRDGLALFLLRVGWDRPKRLTPFGLDVQGAMAAWSPDGSMFAVPLPSSAEAPQGLALYDSEGSRRGFLPSAGEDILSPMFSPGGERIAFAEGAGIGVWDVALDRRGWALDPLRDGSFPRLCGWSPWSGAPLFTRGYAYPGLKRGPDGRRLLPEEVPLEEASGGKATLLTPPGPIPVRRFKAAPVPGGVFYLAQSPGGFPNLTFFDGRYEVRWSAPSEAVHGFAPVGKSECWAWVASGEGEVRLVRFLGPGQTGIRAPGMRANLLALAPAGPGGAWFSGAAASGGPRRLFQADGPERITAPSGDVFGIAASGGSLAAVVAAGDSDGDGERTPSDRAALWISWRVP